MKRTRARANDRLPPSSISARFYAGPKIGGRPLPTICSLVAKRAPARRHAWDGRARLDGRLPPRGDLQAERRRGLPAPGSTKRCAVILRVHVRDHDGDPLQFEGCRALLEGAKYMIVDVVTHEIVERIDAADVERLHYVETPGDGTE